MYQVNTSYSLNMLYVINISVKLGGESIYAGYLARPIKSKLIDMGGFLQVMLAVMLDEMEYCHSGDCLS